jgi:N,N-dimethylformamidase beta subunit-like protein
MRARNRALPIVVAVSIAVSAGCGSGGHGDTRTLAQHESVNAIENRKPGSDEWQFWRYGYTPADDVTEQVKGYASATSVNHGESITFFVSVAAPQPYTIDVYRIGWYGGLGGARATHVGPLAGTRQPECPIDAVSGLIACDWQASHTLAVPSTWVSGIYLAVLEAADRFASFVPFVVRDDERPADVLYQQSVTTYQAYNDYPSDERRGKSLYGGSFGPVTIAGNTRAVAVSFDRPYARDGAGQFLDWEIDFVRWLEREGYDVRYTTDVDTHFHGERLLESKAFLSVGHDEYWSREMYDAVERARDRGVHLGFFGGNAVYWQIRFAPSATGAPGRIMVCYKDAALDPVHGDTTTVRWRDPELGRAEQALVGVQYDAIIADGIHGAYADYVVQHADHWVYAGTGLEDGDVIPGIVGYETDAFDADTPSPTARDGSAIVLSTSPFVDFAGNSTYANSAIYRAPSGAWVFAAGSIGWSLGLDAFGPRAAPDERSQRVTQNVLDAFVNGTPH